MKIAVTGANGFIGHHTISALKSIHELLALSRRPAEDMDPRVAYAVTDYSLESLRDLFAGRQAIIHLAAQRPHAGKDAVSLGNSLLDYRVLQAAEDCGVAHVVLISTRGVYGAQPAPWSEQTPPAPTSLYALAKLHSEQTAAYFGRRGLCVTTLRLAQVFGLGEYEASALTTFIRNAYHNKPITLSVTGVRREYVYVKDVVDAFETTLAQPKSGIYNLGSGEVIGLEEMAQAFLHAFGRRDGSLTAENPRDLGEYSLMDSEAFRRDFSWAPSWRFAAAAEDIRKMLSDKEVAKRYGL